MVIYSEQAAQDLEDVLYGLCTWGNSPLSFDHARQYVYAIRLCADAIDDLSSHQPATRPAHRLYGEYVHIYRRNRRTHWYIIYQWSETTHIAYITRIFNNFTADAIDEKLNT